MKNLKLVEKVKTLSAKGIYFSKKNAPTIFTSLGIVGVIGTAYLTYKASRNVNEIIDHAEKDDEGVIVDKKEVAIKLVKETAPAVVLGISSIAMIVLSHRILSRRLSVCSAALAATVAEYNEYRGVIKEEYGEEKELEHYNTALERFEESQSKLVTAVKTDNSGFVFNTSPEYVSDDHDYNIQFIQSAEDSLQNMLFRRGFLTVNEVYDKFSLPNTKSGAILGWTAADTFSLTPVITNVTDRDGFVHPSIFVSWKRPKYVYHAIRYEA